MTTIYERNAALINRTQETSVLIDSEIPTKGQKLKSVNQQQIVCRWLLLKNSSRVEASTLLVNNFR